MLFECVDLDVQLVCEEEIDNCPQSTVCIYHGVNPCTLNKNTNLLSDPSPGNVDGNDGSEPPGNTDGNDVSEPPSTDSIECIDNEIHVNGIPQGITRCGPGEENFEDMRTRAIELGFLTSADSKRYKRDNRFERLNDFWGGFAGD